MRNTAEQTNLNSILKQQPQYEGSGISQLNNQCSNNNTLKNLETTLNNTQYGKKKNRVSNRKSKKIKKHLKKIKKSLKKLKKIVRRSNKKSSFGNGNLDQNNKLGLPAYENNPSSIYYNDYQNYIRGARPPIPYGPADNARMQLLTGYNGFGKTPSFSSDPNVNPTPGSGSWHLAQPKIDPSADYGLSSTFTSVSQGPTQSNLYKGSTCDLNQQSKELFNVPMTYSDNSYNTSGVRFGKRTKNKNSFGAMLPTDGMYGPNNVGHEAPIPMYHAGSTTYNFSTNQLYPANIGMLGGPTNSTGSYASLGTFSNEVLGVQPDNLTTNARLSTQMGNSFGSRNSFGELIYNPSSLVNGTGLLTLAEPMPSYLDKSKEVTGGEYVSYGKVKSKPKKKSSPKLTLISHTLKTKRKSSPKLTPISHTSKPKDTQDVKDHKNNTKLTSKKKRRFGSKQLTLSPTGQVTISESN